MWPRHLPIRCERHSRVADIPSEKQSSPSLQTDRPRGIGLVGVRAVARKETNANRNRTASGRRVPKIPRGRGTLLRYCKMWHDTLVDGVELLDATLRAAGAPKIFLTRGPKHEFDIVLRKLRRARLDHLTKLGRDSSR
mmetsp:Transcript_19349/g.39730  ORF Transcript_19349/g.39730 Transcript_19349/m.39730 type:complete len:138 (+) Transcript_19349:656-1069(+)